MKEFMTNFTFLDFLAGATIIGMIIYFIILLIRFGQTTYGQLLATL